MAKSGKLVSPRGESNLGRVVFSHFELTSHTFSLQVGGSRVWDYAGDNYVHRLIQSKTDGKVVEFEPAGPNRAAAAATAVRSRARRGVFSPFFARPSGRGET